VAALRRHLELEGKLVTALLTSPVSPRYAFMEFVRRYEVFDPRQHGEVVHDADVVILCDLSSLPRLGALHDPIAASRATSVCFDHHPCENGGPADLNLLDPRATATGCIAWEYIQHVGASVDREIAESVFVSLCTDTGWFRYPNTNAQVMQLVAELASYRLDLPGMYRAIYQSNSAPMLRLLGHVVRTMHEECDGQLVWATVRRDFLRELGVERYESDPVLDVLRSCEGVRIVALFTEQGDGRVLVSLRSRGDLDMNRVARDFGGGGHVYAAGTSLPAESAEEDRRGIIARLRRLLSPR
jgi:phosphoesterase RecJ-like protein